MTNKTYPAFDQFTTGWTATKESQELRRFCNLHPEYTDSLQVLHEICSIQAVPRTLYNMECALNAAIADGRIANRAVVMNQVDEDAEADAAADAAAEAENEAECEAAEEFLRRCPDYKGMGTRHNADVLLRWVKSRKLPVTAPNLLRAFTDCIRKHTFRPPTEEQPVRIDASVEARRKYADQPYESDVARKKRDEILRLAANADRIARRNP